LETLQGLLHLRGVAGREHVLTEAGGSSQFSEESPGFD
jgi:hypothetical protein